MWKTQVVDGSKFVSEDYNNLPLLSEINPNHKIAISTIGNSENAEKKSHASSMKGKSLQSLAKVNWWALTLVVAGVFSLTLGFISMHNPLYEMILEDFLEMRPISPLYSIWAKPPHVITISVNIFEVVNPEEFLASDENSNMKLEMRDIGAVVYREHIEHVNVTRHTNGTMSYTTVRRVEFMEDRNEPGILNKTIIVPNFGLLGALSYLHDASFLTKIAFNLILNSQNEPVFMNTTVYDFLWNYKSEVITLGNSFLPSLVPVNNLGIMHQMYAENVDHLNVKIGLKNGFDQFFNMNEYNYGTEVPGFDVGNGDCNATIAGSSEAYLYNRKMTKKTVIKYFRKSICQVIPLHYERSSELLGLAVNEYVLRPESMSRKKNLTADCYKGTEYGYVLPDGLTDMAKCYFNFPMVLSLPHFFGFEDAPWNTRLSGLKPELVKHQSRILAEPVIGVGVRQYARSQVNVNVRDLSGFPTVFQRFSNMVVPIFWAELMLQEPPPFTLFLMRFCVKYLPLIDQIVPCLFIGSGFLLGAIAMKVNSRRESK